MILPNPTTTNLEEGDFFYDLNDNQLKVYRETSTNNFEFVALAQATGDMEVVDAGVFDSDREIIIWQQQLKSKGPTGTSAPGDLSAGELAYTGGSGTSSNNGSIICR